MRAELQLERPTRDRLVTGRDSPSTMTKFRIAFETGFIESDTLNTQRLLLRAAEAHASALGGALHQACEAAQETEGILNFLALCMRKDSRWSLLQALLKRSASASSISLLFDIKCQMAETPWFALARTRSPSCKRFSL